MKKRLIISLLFALFLPLVAGEILVSPIASVYNAGEQVNFSFTLRPNQALTDFFTVDLHCENDSYEVYRSTYSLNPESEKIVDLSIYLGNFISSSIEGDCYFAGKYGEEIRLSQRFELSRSIRVFMQPTGESFYPGEAFAISGEARNEKNEIVNGFVDVTIENLGLSSTVSIVEGKFNATIILPQNARSGSHVVEALAYEKDSAGIILNEGTSSEIIKVKQITKKVEVALEKTDVVPGKSLSYSILAFDQAGDTVNTTAAVKIYDVENKIVREELVLTLTEKEFELRTNATAGTWKIEAALENATSFKLFSVSELEAIAFTLNGNTLTITNVGNVPYYNTVEIGIGEIKENKQVALEVGESKKFKLNAPDGAYKIVATAGENLYDLGSTFLTGRAISVNEIGRVVSGNILLILSLVVILFVGILVLFLFRRIFREKYLLKKKSYFEPTLKKTVLPQQKNTPATSHLIENGEKQECAVVALSLKNQEALPKEALAVIDSALWKAKSEKGKVYIDDKYRMIIYTPSAASESENSLRAMRVAQTIQRILSDYNRSHAQKIQFGISVHSGELIVENREGKFKFVSLKNTLSLSKKTASLSSSEVLFSENVRLKTAGKIKAEKKEEGLYKLQKIIDRSEHEEFLKKFKS